MGDSVCKQTSVAISADSEVMADPEVDEEAKKGSKFPHQVIHLANASLTQKSPRRRFHFLLQIIMDRLTKRGVPSLSLARHSSLKSSCTFAVFEIRSSS